MNNEIKVSAIIPFYNGADWLCEAVESVLNQTYKNIEIIVVNDGSPENVDYFLDKYGDKIKYFYQENQGVAVARNFAIANATGKYIALLDSDDVWMPEKTAKQVSFMEKTGCMWSHTAFYYWTPGTNELTSPNISDNYGDVFERLFVSFKISTPSVIINAQCFQEHPEINFPEHMRKGQDTGCFVQLAKYYPLGLVNQPLMKIRMRGSNTNANAMIRIQVNVRTLNEIIENRDGLYNNVPKFAKFIKRIYRFNGGIVNMFDKYFSLRCSNKEMLAKILWVLPYALERIYSKLLIRASHRKKDNVNLIQ